MMINAADSCVRSFQLLGLLNKIVCWAKPVTTKVLHELFR